MITQEQLDAAATDALALTRFMTNPSGTTVLNSNGTDVGTLADLGGAQAGGVYASVEDLKTSTASYAVGTRVFSVRESAAYEVVDASRTAHVTTAAGMNLVHQDGPYVIMISGQSNAAGSNADGPNPASDLVQVWDGVISDWGSSDRTLVPLSRSNPDGNLGNNNYALARAHRISEDTGRPVAIIYDAQGGQPISEWVGTGLASPRFAALVSKMSSATASALLSDFGKTDVDEIIFAQGEADFNDNFDVYLDKIKTLLDQFRSQSWCSEHTPIYMMSPSDLHDRYQWRDAMAHLCSQVDNRCVFVPANGLRTEFTETGSGDATHFYGESLWEAGYHRIADARPAEATPTFFYGRATGPADATDTTAMSTFSTMVSRDSWTTEIPPNGPAATGSISWGFECAAEGNYTAALGYQVQTDNLANYGILSGRSLVADESSDYFAGFGFQNTISARYTLCSGRGNIVADEGGTALGMFAAYTSPETDRVMFQVGTGNSTSTRSSAFVARKSGQIEMPALPIHDDNAAALAGGLTIGSIFRTTSGELKIVI